MKTIMCLLLPIYFSITTNALVPFDVPNVNKVLLPAGTLIYLETNEIVSIENATVGKLISFKVSANVVVEEHIIISLKTLVIGKITYFRAAFADQAAEVIIEIAEVQSVDHQKIELVDQEYIFKSSDDSKIMINKGENIIAKVTKDTFIRV